MTDKAAVKQAVTKLLHVLWQAVQGFQKDLCALRASALTMYTLFAIVPVMAMAFGIAKGFGFQQFLEAEVMALFSGQEEIISKVLAFSNNLLERTKGGLMAIFGVILLLYSLIKLMSHIEATFNRIWWISGNRSIIRKVTDYLTTSLAAGALVLFSGSVNIFMTARMAEAFAYLNLPDNVNRLITLGGNFIPVLSTWLLFIFCYVIMPNKRVSIRAAVVGGIIGGTLFQIIQMAYLKFQVGVSSYNAIYGSFAALPLFLVWLQTSWVVLLYGAEIAYAWENSDHHENRSVAWDTMSIRLKKMLVLRMVRLCVHRFAAKEGPPSDVEIARDLRLPLYLVRRLLEVLVSSGILYEVVVSDRDRGYAPGMDIECMSVMDVLAALEQQGSDLPVPGSALESEALEECLDVFERAARESKGERKLKDI